MKLSEWLRQPGKGRTQDALGARVGLTQGRISQIAAEGTGDLETALAIQAATDGDVSVEELKPVRNKRSSSEAAGVRA